MNVCNNEMSALYKVEEGSQFSQIQHRYAEGEHITRLSSLFNRNVFPSYIKWGPAGR